MFYIEPAAENIIKATQWWGMRKKKYRSCEFDSEGFSSLITAALQQAWLIYHPEHLNGQVNLGSHYRSRWNSHFLLLSSFDLLPGNPSPWGIHHPPSPYHMSVCTAQYCRPQLLCFKTHVKTAGLSSDLLCDNATVSQKRPCLFIYI